MTTTSTTRDITYTLFTRRLLLLYPVANPSPKLADLLAWDDNPTVPQVLGDLEQMEAVHTHVLEVFTNAEFQQWAASKGLTLDTSLRISSKYNPTTKMWDYPWGSSNAWLTYPVTLDGETYFLQVSTQ